jgi:hypothetical protein
MYDAAVLIGLWVASYVVMVQYDGACMGLERAFHFNVHVTVVRRSLYFA